jgi:succinyl-CoA synthetase alpha subunit
MPTFNFVRKSFYRDSVTLMRLSRDLEQMAGVTSAAAMMATPANRALLAQAGLLAREGEAAGAADLVVAVVTDCVESADAAHEAVARALEAQGPGGAGNGPAAPRTLEGGLRVLRDANLALISVPGLYAGAEAMRALRAGLHVMLFSDNVSVETEIELKRVALERDRLMMGPDCGTAILDGVPLGFANAVPRGRIGLAAASGTGLQEVTSLIARAGEGISQAVGVGGRDLTDVVGGAMMLRALDLLAGDPGTEVVCVLGKPPGPTVARRLAGAIERLGKPCVVHFPGAASHHERGAYAAATLEDAGHAAVALARGQAPKPVEFTRPAEDVERLIDEGSHGLGAAQRFVRGVYAGGTLAHEAVALLGAHLRDVAPSLTAGGPGHHVTDLGEDIFTLGRPHPMLDGHVRREWIAREGRAADTAVVLLDVVLGSGTAADPAGELLPAIRALRATRDVAVVASVCGTEADTPPRTAQAAALRAAGVLVMDTNAQAVRLAAAIARRAGAPTR